MNYRNRVDGKEQDGDVGLSGTVETISENVKLICVDRYKGYYSFENFAFDLWHDCQF